ncbi:MAG: acyl-CoA dehydrogenase family protein [Trebonia sp.]|jgi:hypothetical protein
MRRLTDTDGLTEFQRDILRTVRDFVDAEVLPVASELDHADVYPDGIVTRLGAGCPCPGSSTRTSSSLT